MIKFTVLGEPKGKGRPRATTVAGHARMYTPPETTNYENLVRLSFRHEQQEQLSGQIRAKITAFMAIPKSTSKKKTQLMIDGDLRPTKKPDLDNIVKIICDALNGYAYADDKQVVEITVSKWYGLTPRVEVEMEEVK